MINRGKHEYSFEWIKQKSYQSNVSQNESQIKSHQSDFPQSELRKKSQQSYFPQNELRIKQN